MREPYMNSVFVPCTVKSCDFTVHVQGGKKKLENATPLLVESVESKWALKIITITYI